MTTHCQAAPLFLYVLNLLMLILSVEDWQRGVRSGKTTLWRQLVLWEGMFCQAIAVYRMKTKMLWMPAEPLVTTDSLTNCFHWWWGGGGRWRWWLMTVMIMALVLVMRARMRVTKVKKACVKCRCQSNWNESKIQVKLLKLPCLVIHGVYKPAVSKRKVRTSHDLGNIFFALPAFLLSWTASLNINLTSALQNVERPHFHMPLIGNVTVSRTPCQGCTDRDLFVIVGYFGTFSRL